MRFGRENKGYVSGFTLLELLFVIGIMAILAAIVLPIIKPIYGKMCVEAVSMDISGMVMEGKQRAMDEGVFGITFDTLTGKISLWQKGADDTWNTADDRLVRSIMLYERGGNLQFGYGHYGPVQEYATTDDGVSFANNRLVCNEELTGNAGTAYIRSAYGGAVAITMNSVDVGYKVYSWKGKWMKR